MKSMISGNQAIAHGALAAGVDVAVGYPGTPSTEALTELIDYAESNSDAPYVEWSVNEKVAFDIGVGVAWTGKRALVTMKMAGINVAADSIMSVTYSGTKGGLVIYVADDPGAAAGGAEQDTRLFALWAGLPVLEVCSPQQGYEQCQFAFELSEQTELPIILRTVTSVAHSVELVEAEFKYKPQGRKPRFERDITRFTKAGADICINQHKTLLERLKKVESIISSRGINRLVKMKGDLFAISTGNLNLYLQEALAKEEQISVLYLESTYPLDQKLISEVLDRSKRIVVFEEFDPLVEMLVRSEANKKGWNGTIIGKMDGHLPRVDKYSNREILKGLALLKQESFEFKNEKPSITVSHPITFCAGCPHRGTYLALNRALKKNKLDKKKTIITGDIGCTIMGMNPPFDSCWTEVSMGSSIGLVQGFARAGIKNPSVATIGDSTFFHAGIPPLINAVQHNSNILVIILDNGWTSMTGFQVNPGTEEPFQKQGYKKVDIERIVESLGIKYVQTIHPFDVEESVEAISQALLLEGVRVIISKEECAIPKNRRGQSEIFYEVDTEECTSCWVCLQETGCLALSVIDLEKKQSVSIDPDLCTGCGLCETSCSFKAIHGKGR